MKKVLVFSVIILAIILSVILCGRGKEVKPIIEIEELENMTLEEVIERMYFN